jgi:hypothetical protein
MIELLLPCGFDTLKYSWIKATIRICTLTDYSVAKNRQHLLWILSPRARASIQPLLERFLFAEIFGHKVGLPPLLV